MGEGSPPLRGAVDGWTDQPCETNLRHDILSNTSLPWRFDRKKILCRSQVRRRKKKSLLQVASGKTKMTGTCK